MHDPFPIPPIPILSRAIQPFSDYFGLTTLPLHVHEVLIAFAGYTLINFVLAPVVSEWAFPVRYPRLSREKKMNWDVHVVSLCQSSLINVLALWVMWTDSERWSMDWEERVWGYTGAAGMIQGLAAGYFLWDLMVTIKNFKSFGPGMLAHAASALTVFSFGFRPFLNFYGCTFILYELSSPFLNFHWFFDKLDMTGSLPQLYNGILLLFTFFGCRLCWGTYQSIRVYQDVWNSVHHKAPATGRSALPLNDGIMRFAGQEYVPIWLALTYLGSNIVLNTLNFYWFGKMIETLRKRFPSKDEKREKPVVVKNKEPNGAIKVTLDQTEVRRRQVVHVDEDKEDADYESVTLS